MDWIAQGGLEFIDLYHDQPFFLYFATTIPHGPTEAERAWLADPRITAKGYLEEAPSVLPPRETLTERLRMAGIAETGKEIVLWLDDAVGALLDKLKEHELLDDTIIVFFNYHGQEAKGTLYQGGLRSLCIVWQRGGFPCGGTSDAFVQNIDFAPTLLALAGMAEPEAGP